MNTLEYFMWEYQQHFLINISSSLDTVFKTLGINLWRDVFLVGVIADSESEEISHEVCIEPEDCSYSVAEFNNVKELASNLEEIDEQYGNFFTGNGIQDIIYERIKRRSLSKAIELIINKNTYRGRFVSFCSIPEKVGKYYVSVIIQLKKVDYDTYYRLTKNRGESGVNLRISLLDSIIKYFLKLCSDALSKPNPGNDIGVIEQSSNEIIRRAGEELSYTAAEAGKDIYGFHGLWDSCNMISALPYEGVPGKGKMIISRIDHPNVEVTIKFKNNIKLSNHRAVRKILEMTSPELSLLTNSYSIYGLGKVINNYNICLEDLFAITFDDYQKWTLLHDNHILMMVHYSQPLLPIPIVDKVKFYSDMTRLFTSVKKADIDLVWNILIEALEQNHGTMLIITESAEQEALRLQQQATQIEPIYLNPTLIQPITSIDGGILLDPQGKCYAIGVILDGIASNNGDPSRGSRYNSAIRYIETIKFPCLIIVISEDGSIDFIPKLKPQIKRSDIIERIDKLESFTKMKDIKITQFSMIMEWFKKNEFYLDDTHCQKINTLRDEIQSRITTNIKRVYFDFVPNGEMNDSYFID